jgi:hypothetical protein
VQRLREGKPVVTPGDGTTTLQPACAVDTGRKIAAIAGLAGAIGRPLNLAGPRPLTHDEYVRAIASVVGVEPDIVHIPTDVLLRLDDAAIQNDLLPELTRYPHFVSNNAFDCLVPDFEFTTTLAEGIRSYVERQDALNRFAEAPEPPDEHVLARWGAATEAFERYRSTR